MYALKTNDMHITLLKENRNHLEINWNNWEK